MKAQKALRGQQKQQGPQQQGQQQQQQQQQQQSGVEQSNSNKRQCTRDTSHQEQSPKPALEGCCAEVQHQGVKPQDQHMGGHAREGGTDVQSGELEAGLQQRQKAGEGSIHKADSMRS